MYLSLIFYPFLSFFFTIAFARFLDRDVVIRLNIFGLIVAIAFSTIAFFEVVLSKTATSVDLGT
jgi:hypothetical protein